MDQPTGLGRSLLRLSVYLHQGCLVYVQLVLSCLAAADAAEAVSLQRVDRVLSRVMGRSVSDRAAVLGRSI